MLPGADEVVRSEESEDPIPVSITSQVSQDLCCGIPPMTNGRHPEPSRHLFPLSTVTATYIGATPDLTEEEFDAQTRERTKTQVTGEVVLDEVGGESAKSGILLDPLRPYRMVDLLCEVAYPQHISERRRDRSPLVPYPEDLPCLR